MYDLQLQTSPELRQTIQALFTHLDLQNAEATPVKRQDLLGVNLMSNPIKRTETNFRSKPRPDARNHTARLQDPDDRCGWGLRTTISSI